MRKGRLGIYVTTQADRTDLGFILRPGWLQVFPLHWLRVYSIFLAGRYKSILVHSLHSCPSKLDYLTNSPLQASSFVPLVNTHTASKLRRIPGLGRSGHAMRPCLRGRCPQRVARVREAAGRTGLSPSGPPAHSPALRPGPSARAAVTQLGLRTPRP